MIFSAYKPTDLDQDFLVGKVVVANAFTREKVVETLEKLKLKAEVVESLYVPTGYFIVMSTEPYLAWIDLTKQKKEVSK